MNDGLDSALVLPDAGGKPSKQYRSSPYTVREYSALPYCTRRSVDMTCDEQEGLTYATHNDEASEKPYTVGRRTTTPDEVPSQPSSPQPAMLTADIAPATSATEALTDSFLSPPQQPASLTPEPAATAEPAPAIYYDLLAVVGSYLTLTPTAENEYWTHCGPSPYKKGDEYSLAINANTGFFKCYASETEGRAVDFVMFMEECDQQEAFEWLDAHFPIEVATPEALHFTGELPTPTPEVVDENGPLVATEPEEAIEQVADGPSCAYPGYPRFAEPITMEPTPASTPEGEQVPDFDALAAATSQAAAPAPVEVMPPVAIDNTIYSTTDYDLFQKVANNRKLKARNVRELVAQIGRVNLLEIDPILVNKDMGIIDGQHRLAAARELGVPIFYKIVEKLDKRHIAILNSTKSIWQGPDYLHYFTVEGDPSYIALTEFMGRHPLLSFSNAKMMVGASNKGSADDFRNGLWKSGDIERAERVAELIERIAAEVKGFRQATHTGFVGALFYCTANVVGFDTHEMMRTILKQPMSLVPCASHPQWLAMLGKIYNWHKRIVDHLRFE